MNSTDAKGDSCEVIALLFLNLKKLGFPRTTIAKSIYLCIRYNEERCQSDRMGRTRNPVNGLSVPWV